MRSVVAGVGARVRARTAVAAVAAAAAKPLVAKPLVAKPLVARVWRRRLQR
jgi:hypothetical protein